MGPQIPFGAMVYFIPTADELKAMPKFGLRTLPGVFLGNYLQPGGRWDGEYLCISLEDLKDLDLSKKTRWRDIRIHRTQECEVSGEVEFPLKGVYEKALRCMSHHDCVKPEDHIPLLKPSTEGLDEGDPEVSGGASGSGGVAPAAPRNEAVDAAKFRVDTMGRRYQLDEFGNRAWAGSSRPPYVNSDLWKTLSKKDKKTLTDEWKASEKARLDADAARPFALAAKLVQKKGKKSSAANALLMLTGLMGMLVDSSDDQLPVKGTRKERRAGKGKFMAMACSRLADATVDPSSTEDEDGSMPSESDDVDWESSPYADDPTPPSEIPKMPCLPAAYRQPHRDKVSKPNHAHMKALVARSVPPSEVRRNLPAQAAMKLEWERLRQMGTWDESKVGMV
jgi:hypothetical protein